MDRYRGVIGGDTMTGGGAYVAEHGFGHEMFNFLPFQGYVYGYVQPPGRKDRWDEARIKLTRLGASGSDILVSGILVVWVATASTGGTFVVGWYKNATVYRDHQIAPEGSNRQHGEITCGYYARAASENAECLPPDERVFSVPRGEGGIGQANIWYADDPEQNSQIRSAVLSYINTRQIPVTSIADQAAPRQPDPLLRQRVEEAAVLTTKHYFSGLQYRVDSVEADNIGWDLNAVLGQRHLRLEVKGLSGSQVVLELTPNEYAAMQRYRDSYRVCIVTNALTDPCLIIFAYSSESSMWESQIPVRRILNIREIVAARCSAD
ncbi:DUF3883 domain-containing protein [Fimbriiglobus ruber]|uniref:DUF3883 domain-containing protein n=1 Tax=Fimbriiglobus ruber TaxID=1908690 RepID=UPI00137AE66B|nr:DUF3883 domain-containing protein [Fimbriiglobus ruber]